MNEMAIQPEEISENGEHIIINGQVEVKDQDLKDIMEKLIINAKKGDTDAAKLVLDRSVPVLKPITPSANIFHGMDEHSCIHLWYPRVIQAFLNGDISSDQAINYLSLVVNRNININNDINEIKNCDSDLMVKMLMEDIGAE